VEGGSGRHGRKRRAVDRVAAVGSGPRTGGRSTFQLLGRWPLAFVRAVSVTLVAFRRLEPGPERRWTRPRRRATGEALDSFAVVHRLRRELPVATGTRRGPGGTRARSASPRGVDRGASGRRSCRAAFVGRSDGRRTRSTLGARTRTARSPFRSLRAVRKAFSGSYLILAWPVDGENVRAVAGSLGALRGRTVVRSRADTASASCLRSPRRGRARRRGTPRRRRRSASTSRRC
jgi:hypothetical protein